MRTKQTQVTLNVPCVLMSARPVLVILIMIVIPDQKAISCKFPLTHLDNVAKNVRRTKMKMTKIEYAWLVTQIEKHEVGLKKMSA